MHHTLIDTVTCLSYVYLQALGPDAEAMLSSIDKAVDDDEDDDEQEAFDPDFTYAERVIASTVPPGQDYFDVKPIVHSSVAPSGAVDADGDPIEPPQPMYLVKWKSE